MAVKLSLSDEDIYERAEKEALVATFRSGTSPAYDVQLDGGRWMPVVQASADRIDDFVSKGCVKLVHIVGSTYRVAR